MIEVLRDALPDNELAEVCDVLHGAQETDHLTHRPEMQEVLSRVQARLEPLVGLTLTPYYAGIRVYGEGDRLFYHVDGAQGTDTVTASVTLTVTPGVVWPLRVEDDDGKWVDVVTEPGEAAVFTGNRHGREMFPGSGKQEQLLLMYAVIKESDSTASCSETE